MGKYPKLPFIKDAYYIFSIFYNEKTDDFVSIMYNTESHEMHITNGGKKYSISIANEEEINNALYYIKSQIKKYLELTGIYIWEQKNSTLKTFDITRIFKTKNGKYFGHFFTPTQRITRQKYKDIYDYKQAIQATRGLKNTKEIFLNLKNDVVVISKEFAEYFLK